MGGKVLDLPEFIAYDQAKTEGIKILVRDKIEDKIPEEKIVDKLRKNYDLSPDEARRYIDQCMAEINK